MKDITVDFHYYDKVRSRLGKRMGGFDCAFRYLSNIENPVIIETGCARQEDNFSGDGQSSLLFDAYVTQFGGSFTTIDISEESVNYCRSKMTKSSVILGDSITELKKINDLGKTIDFLYLDSFDAPQEEPDVVNQSALHHIYELLTIFPSLKKGTLIGVDDCWMDRGMVSGKGRYVSDYMSKINNSPVHRGYQFFWVL